MVTHTFATPNYILFLHQKGIVCVIENQRTVTELFCCCLFLINIAVYVNAKVGVDALIDPKKNCVVYVSAGASCPFGPIFLLSKHKKCI